MKTQLISAVCTPLCLDYSLHLEGLESHIEDQWRSGISALLIAGTMGLMQLQADRTYVDLVKHAVRISKGRGKILVGVGDTSFVRTRDRIQVVGQFAIDGVVVLSPYLVKFSQAELSDYFQALAEYSSKPLYLYDQPTFTGTKLERRTVESLIMHPNIRGIKCSGTWEDTKQLIAHVGDKTQVIPAQAHLVDELVRVGIRYNLDGIFSIFPSLPVAIVEAAEENDWQKAAQLQQDLSQLLQLMREKYLNVFGSCEVILNARGISGQLAPAPLKRLNQNERDRLLSEPLIQKLISGVSSSL